MPTYACVLWHSGLKCDVVFDQGERGTNVFQLQEVIGRDRYIQFFATKATVNKLWML